MGTIWASSTIRNRPEQTFEVQTIGAPPEYWAEVIRPGDPHEGQASTATKLGAKDSRRWAKSSRKKMSPGVISESDDRFDKCRSSGELSRAIGTGNTPYILAVWTRRPASGACCFASSLPTTYLKGIPCARGDRRGFQTGTFVPFREKARKLRIFRQNSCYFPGRPRRKSHVCRGLRTGPEQPQIPLRTWGSPTASCHRRLERDEAWRRMSTRCSLILSRLILLPSPHLSAVLVLSLRKYATISGSAPRFALRHLCGHQRSPILERGDEPKLPGQGSSQRKFPIPSALFQRRLPTPSSPRSASISFRASLANTQETCKYLKTRGLLGHNPMPTEAFSRFPESSPRRLWCTPPSLLHGEASPYPCSSALPPPHDWPILCNF